MEFIKQPFMWVSIKKPAQVQIASGFEMQLKFLFNKLRIMTQGMQMITMQAPKIFQEKNIQDS